MLDGVWFSQITNPLKDSLEKAFCMEGISVLYCCVGMEENRAPFPDGLNFHFTRMLGVVSIMVLLNLPSNCLQTEDLEKVYYSLSSLLCLNLYVFDMRNLDQLVCSFS